MGRSRDRRRRDRPRHRGRCRLPGAAHRSARSPRFCKRHFEPQHEADPWWGPLSRAGQRQAGARSADRARIADRQRAGARASDGIHRAELSPIRARAAAGRPGNVRRARRRSRHRTHPLADAGRDAAAAADGTARGPVRRSVVLGCAVRRCATGDCADAHGLPARRHRDQLPERRGHRRARRPRRRCVRGRCRDRRGVPAERAGRVQRHRRLGRSAARSRRSCRKAGGRRQSRLTPRRRFAVSARRARTDDPADVRRARAVCDSVARQPGRRHH